MLDRGLELVLVLLELPELKLSGPGKHMKKGKRTVVEASAEGRAAEQIQGQLESRWSS